MTEPVRIAELYAGTARSVHPFRAWRRAKVALLADNNEHARNTYLRNYPKAPYRRLDLSTISPETVIELAGGPIDVLLGCPPCQGFSEGGKRDPKDPRNNHLKIFADIALASLPRAVAMENVPLAAASPEFKAMTDRLSAAGYKWSAAIVNAAQFGSCQSRQRLIFVAFDKKIGIAPTFPAPTHGGDRRLFSYARRELRSINKDNLHDMLGITPAAQRVAGLLPENLLRAIGPSDCVTVEDTISDLPPEDSPDGIKLQHVSWNHGIGIKRRMQNIREGARWSGAADHYAHTYGRLHRHGLSRTITGSFPYAGSGRYWHPERNRSLTLREAARIQGFPDSFKFLEPVSSRHNAQLVGNALDAHLAQVVYGIIRPAVARSGPKMKGVDD